MSEALILNPEEVRVVGALIEKQVTTPEYYPLTLNALRQACNQLSNREPVVSFDEKTVAWALESLRERKLVRVVTTADGRVPKYRHVLDETLGLKSPEMAVMCVLMLRGAQTVGEIRTRSERLYPFSALSFVETTLEDLMTRDVPLVVKLPRQSGQKESRYAHLLGGEIDVSTMETESASSTRVEAATLEVRGERERIARLEEELRAVRAELQALREQFGEFKKQFE
ncbi:MAG TPA: YceH family protein [Pyrinomonadaceae bacterium]|nr:YceH family protein [Pyrinomonadaceae bacterium]